MTRYLLDFLKRQTQSTITIIGLILVVLLGIVDYILGHEISFSIFYLFPIILVTWWSRKNLGIVVAIISTFVWFSADITSGHRFTNHLITFWNALVRLGFFVIIVTTLANLKHAQENQARIARELQESIDNIKILRGLIPICAWCHKVRNDQGYWQQVEAYVTEHSEASFTHGICEECKEREFVTLRQKKG